MHVLGTISHDINSGLIPPLLKFATSLRYYVTGSTQLIHADLHGISQPIVSRIVRDVSAALASLRKTHIYFPADIQGKRNVCAKFSDEVRLNNVIGAIDCTVYTHFCDTAEGISCSFLQQKTELLHQCSGCV